MPQHTNCDSDGCGGVCNRAEMEDIAFSHVPLREAWCLAARDLQSAPCDACCTLESPYQPACRMRIASDNEGDPVVPFIIAWFITPSSPLLHCFKYEDC